MIVYCIKCGREIPIYPDGNGYLTPNLAMWVGELGEKCNACRLTVAVGRDSVASGAIKEGTQCEHSTQ